MLFDEAVSLYWADKSRRLRGNTLEGYASAIRRHLMPAWRGRELESITHDEVQSWVDSIPTYGAADAVVVWNGDWNAANVLAVPFARTSTTSAGGNVGAYLTSAVDWPGSGKPGSMRVGYMIVRGS